MGEKNIVHADWPQMIIVYNTAHAPCIPVN